MAEKTPSPETAPGDYGSDYTIYMKIKYNQPAAEQLQELLAAELMENSIGGTLEGYGTEEDFVW